MDPIEAQSRAMIASALIMRGAVAVPCSGERLLHADGLRLRALTDDVYRLLTETPSGMTPRSTAADPDTP